MIYFDTSALVALPLWARDEREVVSRVPEGEPTAVCAPVRYEFRIGPIDSRESRLA